MIRKLKMWCWRVRLYLDCRWYEIHDFIVWLIEPIFWACSWRYRHAYYDHCKYAWKMSMAALPREIFFREWVGGKA